MKKIEAVIRGWVARDENGDLFMYSTKPFRDKTTELWFGGLTMMTPSNDLFPDITWDDEPIKVELIIKRKT